MALSDIDPHLVTPGGTCSVRLLYDQMDPDDEETLHEWMNDETLPSSAIWRAIREECNFDAGQQSVQRHRNGSCKCDVV